MTEPNYGTSGGVVLTETLVQELAREAEDGFDLEELRSRQRVGRPRIGTERTVVFQVRIEPAMREELNRRALAEGTTPSELARQAIQGFLLDVPGSISDATSKGIRTDDRKDRDASIRRSDAAKRGQPSTELQRAQRPFAKQAQATRRVTAGYKRAVRDINRAAAKSGGVAAAQRRGSGKPAIEVEPRSDGKWARQKQGTGRAASVHETRAAAEEAARAQARRERTELIVKGRDGQIQRRDSYGNDPRRSRR